MTKRIIQANCPCCSSCEPMPEYIELSIDYGGSVFSGQDGGAGRLVVDCSDVLGDCYKSLGTATVRLNRVAGDNCYTFSGESGAIVQSATYCCYNDPRYCGQDNHSIRLVMNFSPPLSGCLPLDANGDFQMPDGYCKEDWTTVTPNMMISETSHELCLRRMEIQNTEENSCSCVDVETPFSFCCHEDKTAELSGYAYVGDFSCDAQGPFYITKSAWERAMCQTWDDDTMQRINVGNNPPCADIVDGWGGTWFSAHILAVVKVTATAYYPGEVRV
ncbi:MAG: hypothetical protein Q4D98_02990 [Planctomycetia bacterium]|nr:hypothetical protein [Planctomycetia bacterium]